MTQASLNLLLSLPLHQIGSAPPRDFDPKQVLCRELGRTTKGTPRYIDIDRPTRTNEPRFTTIDEFAANIAVSGYSRNPSQPPEKEEDRWIDIKISRDTWIVIVLSADHEWTFTTLAAEPSSLEGIMLMWLSDDHIDPRSHYGSLRFVDASGAIHDKPMPGCRVAYFAAKPMRNPPNGDRYEQRICYIVDYPAGSHEFIDPDIRFPGNGSS